LEDAKEERKGRCNLCLHCARERENRVATACAFLSFLVRKKKALKRGRALAHDPFAARSEKKESDCAALFARRRRSARGEKGQGLLALANPAKKERKNA